ncbi:hypothetical protein, partial [Microvirga pakistanensis]
DDDEAYEDGPVTQPVPRAALRPEPASARVAPAPGAPKPGRRMAREAQPSLLDDSNYQLPQLNLLAEPKKSSAPL